MERTSPRWEGIVERPRLHQRCSAIEEEEEE
jgi:hypothetical protein